MRGLHVLASDISINSLSERTPTMFDWIRRLSRAPSRNKGRDFDKFVRIVAQIQREHVERKGVSRELHYEFVRLCDEAGFKALPVDGDQIEATLRREFHKYFG